MTDSYLMEADCIHGNTWYECAACMTPGPITLDEVIEMEHAAAAAEVPDSLRGLVERDGWHPTMIGRSGAEVSYWQWMQLLGNHRYKVVRQDEIGGLFLSTVWLGYRVFGLDVFETMLFDDGSGDFQWRWATEREALAAHMRLLDVVLCDYRALSLPALRP